MNRTSIPTNVKLSVLAECTEPDWTTAYCHHCLDECLIVRNGRSVRLLDGFEWDHLVPVSRGGDNSPENVVISCGPCNRAKGARLDWISPIACYYQTLK